MNRSKAAAVLTLLGAFAVGAVTMYTYSEVTTSTPALRDPCGNQRTANDLKNRVYEDLGMNDQQRSEWNSLIDSRTKAINEIYAIPRVGADSIRAETRDKQRALLTDDQRAKLDARQAAFRQRSIDRQKQCEAQQQSTKNK